VAGPATGHLGPVLIAGGHPASCATGVAAGLDLGLVGGHVGWVSCLSCVAGSSASGTHFMRSQM
jgi:hypothetical protein